MIAIENFGKEFNQEYVFRNVNFELEKGEIVSIVGPSGTGKSTLLKCLAGLEAVTEGSLYIDKSEITNNPANNRPVVMMFQQSLLFPHLTVLDNVMYGLQFQIKTKKVRKAMAEDFLEKVSMSLYAKSMPHELSGGQQQRVALIRALITKPQLLLLDEPFSSLDTDLRQETREWVKWLLKKQETTAIFVTHDMEEAMLLGDRVAVFGEGKLQQIGTPLEVYFKPKSTFVASFYCDGLLLDKNSFVHNDKIELIGAGEEGHFYRTLNGWVKNTRLKHGKFFYDIELQGLKKQITLQIDRVLKGDEQIKIGIKSEQDILHVS